MARTYADAVTVDFEHGAMDFTQLRQFMRGIRDGGPTRSGHSTPCVFVTSGIIGLDEAYARANTWIMAQFLDAGVHGVHICHARDPKAIEVLAQEGAGIRSSTIPRRKWRGAVCEVQAPGSSPPRSGG